MPGAPYLASLDSEDDGEGNPFLWCIVHERGQWSGERRDHVLAFLEVLRERVKPRPLEVWATNLEYDIVNTFGTEHIADVSLRFGRAALCGARWRGIEFRDTIRHLPISVAQFGELVGLKKLEGGLFDRAMGARTLAAFKRRCMRDAAITFRAARFFHKTYGDLGVRPRMTLASTALNLWRERFWKRQVHRPEEAIYLAAREAYHGGRTQAFAVGTFEKVRVIDAASMFPWAMCAGDLPLPWGLSRVVARGAPVVAHGIYRARVRSALALPCLPVRSDGGTIYPNGTWVGWYVGEELLAFQRNGGHVTVLDGFEFSERCRPFDSYIRTLFELKQKSRGAQRLLYKTLANATYGKFGQQGRRVHAVPIERLLEMPDPPLDWRAWCGLAIFSKDHEAPPWSNFVWPAFITARARVRLAETARRVIGNGGRVLYCDTDSLIFQGPSRFPKTARNVGDFELRGSYRKVVIVGKKEYALETSRNRWDIHAKGVPFAERGRYLSEGIAEFSRPVKIRESTRIGVPANTWRKVTKRRRTILRGRKSDGTVPTPHIRG